MRVCIYSLFPEAADTSTRRGAVKITASAGEEVQVGDDRTRSAEQRRKSPTAIYARV